MKEKYDSIYAKMVKSRYSDFYHLHFLVNNKQLDELLEEALPGKYYLGLVPTLLDWLDDENERKLVWDRVKIEDNVTKLVPILMCPDDCDFSCTIILAEVVSDKDYVYWKKIGVDIRKNYYDLIGTEIEWFNDFGPFYLQNKNI